MKINATKLFIIFFFVSSLMIEIATIEPELIEEKIDFKQESTPNQITPSHIDLWSQSSSLNPLVPFTNCVLSDIVVDSHGNTYVSGTFTSEIGFGNITLSTFHGDYSIFIAKLSPDAIWEWAIKSLGDIDPDNDSSAHSRAMTLDIYESKLYVVGNVAGINTFGVHTVYSPQKNMFVASINLTSHEFEDVLTPLTSGSVSNAEAVIARPGGGVYIAGDYTNSSLFSGNLSLPSAYGHSNAFVASLNGVGQWIWSTSTDCHQLATPVCGGENATSLTLDHKGNVVVLGVMADNTTFGFSPDPGHPGPVLMGAGNLGIFVWTIHPDFGMSTNVIRTNNTGNAMSSKIISLGNVLIVSGNFHGKMNLSGINVTSYSPSYGSGFVASLTFNGARENWNWVRAVNGSSDSGPTSGRFTTISRAPWAITDIDITPDNTIIVGGEYWGPALLDGLVMPSTGSIATDAFLAQLSNQGDWLNMMIVGGPGHDGMTRVASSSNGQVYMGLDSYSVAITFGDSTHYPSDRSVIVGSFEWDRDSDEVSDANDQCGGYPDDLDVDNDNIPDDCDILIDSDQDKIPDDLDHCPFIPGIIAYDGCPKPILVGCTDSIAVNYSSLANTNSTTCEYDSDGDGVNDSIDLCDYEPEDFDGWEDEDGCIDPNNDADSFNDIHDSCPNVHATANGNFDNNSDGCPDFCDLQCQICPGCDAPDPDDKPGCTYGTATNFNDSANIDDGSCEFPVVDPGGGNNGSCDGVCITGAGDVADLILIGGIALLSGLGISSLLPQSGGNRLDGGNKKKPDIDLDDIGDIFDDIDIDLDLDKPDIDLDKPNVEKKIVKKTTGGSDHYFKPGVERQKAMTDSADPLLDDYVED